MKRSSVLSWLLPLSGGLVLFGTWCGIKVAGNVEPWLLPWPWDVWNALFEERETLQYAALNSGFAALVGFLFSVGVAWAVSLALASAGWVRKTWYPWIVAFQMIPVIVVTPIFVLWLGQGLPAITAVTFMIAFFPIVANTTMGLVSTDKNLIDLFAVLNASKAQEILYLRLPFALPYFLTGMKIAGTLAVIGALVGDFYAGEAEGGKGGLGYLVVSYNAQLEIPALYAVAVVSALLGLVFVGSVNFLHWLLLHNWHESSVARQ